LLAPARLGQQGNGIYYGVRITSSSSTRRPHRSDNYVAPKAPHTRDPGPVKFHIQIQTQIHLQAHIKIHVKVTRQWQPRLDVPSGPGVGLPWPQQHFSSLTRLMGSWGPVWPESGRTPSKTLTYILVSYQLRPILYVPFCWPPLGEGAWLRFVSGIVGTARLCE
jgi:hypothetical protein